MVSGNKTTNMSTHFESLRRKEVNMLLICLGNGHSGWWIGRLTYLAMIEGVHKKSAQPVNLERRKRYE